MLRDELLKAKNDEIERCVQSRKRKLSELYFATVVCLGTNVSLQTEQYRRQEAAFLDANDITKGRFFDQDTLPRRPSLATIPDAGASSIHAPKQHGIQVQTDNRPLSRAGDASTGVNGLGILDTSDKHVSAPAKVDAPRSPGWSPNSNASDSSKPQEPRDLRSLHPQLYPTPLLPQKQTLAQPASSPADITFPNTKARAVSIAFPQDAAPSSPISTGPSSLNTPATDRSPASTSTEESVAYPDPLSTTKSQDESVSRIPGYQAAIATKVPSTPDEQLKFEAAMSNASVTPKPRLEEIRQDKPSFSTTPIDAAPSATIPTPSETPITQKPATDLVEVVRSPGSETVDKASPANVGGAQVSRPERMTTRVSSGAIRHKSVSEILGETPRSPISPTDKALFDKQPRERTTSPRSQASVTESQLQLREKRDRKGRSKLSTVVFPKPASPQKHKSLALSNQTDAPSPNDQDDYLYLLFLVKAYFPPRGTHLSSLIATAHKTLSTANHMTDYAEQANTRTLKRLYQLQHSNRWPLRQLQRSPEPPRSATHWDMLLDHMKWMRMDFREERKWKIAAAKNCAEWCAEYVASKEEDRAILRVRVRPQPVHMELDVEIPLQNGEHPTPDLVPSADDDSVSDGFNDEFQPDLDYGPVPAAVFSLPSDEFTFRMEKTLASEKILEELPLYTPVKILPGTKQPSLKQSPDAVWKKDIAPVSKWIDGKIRFMGEGPPRKKSRYDYDTHDYDDNDDADANSVDIPPEQTNVALFQPENKPIRDRVHPSHCFRPPTEHPMPSVGFYESRQSSQWTTTVEVLIRCGTPNSLGMF
ncbi:predicted protein [Uncinocarpus reesii 1704]|uniref:HSA domain-containing protein n=1 Tax=Uncinocarpus reesii (strain UAMH 1704) TaxID=336963 RepID=C4JUG8_UNCRE|nr:uncharacterized protein UREG_04771 [Uncinocarpus reesii 1704]EEP79929.1 predicted protein [Uncinocarpus reesii 1704]